MSERKVLQKYYPPDFDPSKIARSRVPKNVGPKVMTVRLMAPFSMKCMSCGEYIYKGRKFNSRKETTDEKYLNIPIYRFYIRCTRCSAEITFKTDPKGMDYTCERGAKRNFEVWRKADGDDDDHKLETDEERLDRLEAEEAERGAMEVLEGKVVDAKREMEIADALDEIRTRNARIQRAEGKGEVDNVLEQAERARLELELEKRRVEAEDEETARRAFAKGFEVDEGGEHGMGPASDVAGDGVSGKVGASKVTATQGSTAGSMPPPEFKRVVKKKKDFSAALGIKKKPALV